MEAKVASRKDEFMISCQGSVDTVYGYRVDPCEWAKLFAHKSSAGEWTVSELGTGLALAYGKTRKGAIDSAVLKLTEIGQDEWIKKVHACPTIKALVEPAPAPVSPPAPHIQPGTIRMIRVKKGEKQDGHYVGRGSALGNPYRMKKETDRIPCILKYRAWLWTQLKDKNSKARAAVSSLVREYKSIGKLTLICYCPPLPCHSEVIANAVRYCAGEPVKPYSWVKK